MPRSPGVASGILRAPRVLLALLTAVAFGPGVTNGFVWLDHWQVEGGGLVARSWPELWGLLSQPLGAMPGWEGTAPYARPGVILLLSAIHALAGNHAFAYHLASILIHLANVLLVYGLFVALGVAPRVAFFAAALFAGHPLQTAAVSWISGIADPLFTLGVLCALRLQLAAPARLGMHERARVSAWIFFLWAMLAKETAAVFPFLLIATYVLLAATSDAAFGRARRIAAAVAPFLLALAGLALYRIFVLSGSALGTTLGTVPLSVRLRTVPRLIVDYLVLPVRLGALTVCDDYALSARWDAGSVVSLLVLIGLCIGLLRYWRRWPYVAFGLIWVLIGLVPVLNVVPILHYRADRFFYFPFIGWALSFSALLDHAVTALSGRLPSMQTVLHRAAPLVALLAVLTLLVLTIRRNALFADDVTLFEATVPVSPFCREARTALGDAYLRSGRTPDAIEQYHAALSARSDRVSYVVPPKVLINLGMAELARNEFSAAEDAFSQAHRLQPHLLHPLFGLGMANLGLGHAAEAATWLEQAYAVDATDPDVVFNLALSYDRVGRGSDALRLYRRYLEIAPSGRARALAERRLQILAVTGQ